MKDLLHFYSRFHSPNRDSRFPAPIAGRPPYADPLLNALFQTNRLERVWRICTVARTGLEAERPLDFSSRFTTCPTVRRTAATPSLAALAAAAVRVADSGEWLMVVSSASATPLSVRLTISTPDPLS